MAGQGRAAIDAAVSRQFEATRYCHELARVEGGEDVTLEVLLEWIIEPDGRVSEVSVKSDRPDLSFEQCLRSQMRRWRLPCPGPDAMLVQRRMVFRAGGGRGASLREFDLQDAAAAP